MTHFSHYKSWIKGNAGKVTINNHLKYNLTKLTCQEKWNGITNLLSIFHDIRVALRNIWKFGGPIVIRLIYIYIRWFYLSVSLHMYTVLNCTYCTVGIPFYYQDSLGWIPGMAGVCNFGILQRMHCIKSEIIMQ